MHRDQQQPRILYQLVFLFGRQLHRGGGIVPALTVQQRLRAVLTDPARVLSEHISAYNMLSYAWGDKYQQSNQVGVGNIGDGAGRQHPHPRAGAGLAQVQGLPADRAQARPGARMLKANIAFDDHPNKKRFSDRIATIGADSVFAFLEQSGMQVSHFVVGL